ncbi:hypothetical protein VTN00DRAFT_4451 [Thermoascus crustaceus]|uniref:uncharacterized protein n=1 Tax=Thermoascus crustaceus TaxID=5088 RepID=UPI003743E5A7
MENIDPWGRTKLDTERYQAGAARMSLPLIDRIIQRYTSEERMHMCRSGGSENRQKQKIKEHQNPVGFAWMGLYPIGRERKNKFRKLQSTAQTRHTDQHQNGSLKCAR